MAVYFRKEIQKKGLGMKYLFIEVILPNSKILLGAIYKAPGVDEIDELEDKISNISVTYIDCLEISMKTC